MCSIKQVFAAYCWFFVLVDGKSTHLETNMPTKFSKVLLQMQIVSAQQNHCTNHVGVSKRQHWNNAIVLVLSHKRAVGKLYKIISSISGDLNIVIN